MMRHPLAATIRFLKAEDGPTAVEYAVMLAMIILAVIGTVQAVGTATNSTFANGQLNSTLSGS